MLTILHHKTDVNEYKVTEPFPLFSPVEAITLVSAVVIAVTIIEIQEREKTTA